MKYIKTFENYEKSEFTEFVYFFKNYLEKHFNVELEIKYEPEDAFNYEQYCLFYEKDGVCLLKTTEPKSKILGVQAYDFYGTNEKMIKYVIDLIKDFNKTDYFSGKLLAMNQIENFKTYLEDPDVYKTARNYNV